MWIGFCPLSERYTDIPELTPCILHEFVEKIVVHAASDPDRARPTATQEVDIYYKGIGSLGNVQGHSASTAK